MWLPCLIRLLPECGLIVSRIVDIRLGPPGCINNGFGFLFLFAFHRLTFQLEYVILVDTTVLILSQLTTGDCN